MPPASKKTGTAPTPRPKKPKVVAPTNLDKSLRDALQFPLKGLDARIETLKYTWAAPGLEVDGSFYYLSFQDHKPSVSDFVDYIYGRITYFCLPRQERKRLTELHRTTKDDRHLIDLVDKAKNLLIKAREQSKTLGEPGELILFILLEAMLRAPRIACKMYLKTNANMPVHGSDAIHVKYDKSTDTLTLLWGESKVYASLPDALDKVCKSISQFNTPNKGVVPKDRDITILRDHMDIDDPATEKALLEFFDPYSNKSNNRREVYACFVGFKFDFFGQPVDKKQLKAMFDAAYLKRIHEACKLFGDKITKNKLNHLNFHFFLIPFPCVDQLRELFLTRLGVEI